MAKRSFPAGSVAGAELVAGFEPVDCDKTRELITDPALTPLYSTYPGGRNGDQATAMRWTLVTKSNPPPH